MFGYGYPRDWRRPSPFWQKANAVIGLFLGLQLGAYVFTGHLVTPASLHLPGGSAVQESAVPPAPAARGGGRAAGRVDVAGLPATAQVSPWSIFSQGGGPHVAVTWGRRLLGLLGLPATAPRLRFVYDWEVSEGGGGLYNPVNQGPVPGAPELTTTGQQYGGGAADYASWGAGLRGAADYLHMPNYAAVLAALARGDYWGAARALWASPWAHSHYGYGSAWHAPPLPGP